MTREHEEEVDRAFDEGQNSMMRSIREARRERDAARAERDAAIRERDAVKAGAFDVFRQAVAERDEALALLSKARERLANFGDPQTATGFTFAVASLRADLAKILGTGETT